MMIELKNVNKYFYRRKKNEIHVINNTSLKLDDTGLVALLGPSGCGKTTLLNAIGGLDNINSGSIYINGERISKRSSHSVDRIRNLNIGYIFQDYYLVDDMSVFDNVALSLKLCGIKNKEEIKKRVNFVLEKVGMYRYRNRAASMLSGGERQRVGIARAIVKDPNIIIADEPTGNLDSKNTIEIMNIIKAISKDRLVILVTHESELAMFYASRILKIEDGTIVSDETNSHDIDLDYKMDNKVYLLDMKNHKNIDNENVNIDYYSDSDNKLDITIVVQNGNIYIKSKNKVDVIDSNSGIELVNDHYQKISKNIYNEYNFDFHEIIDNNYKKKYSSVYNIFNSIKNGFSKIRNYSFIKKVLLFGFFVSGMFVTYSASSLFSVNNINDSDFVTLNKNYLVVDKMNVTTKEIEDIERDPNVNYVIPGKSTVNFSFEINDFHQTSDYEFKMMGSLSSINMLSDQDIINGRIAKNKNEVVIDKMIYDNILLNPSASVKNAGVLTVGDMLNRQIYLGNLKYTIVGISNTNSPSIYTYESEFTNIISLNKSVTSTTYGSYIEEEVSNNLLFDYKIYKDSIKLKKGNYPVNDYEVIINEIHSEEYKIGKYLDYKVNDKKLKVVGYYTSSNTDIDYYFVNNNTIKYNNIRNNDGFVIFAKDKDAALKKYSDLKLNIRDSYNYSKSNYIKDRRIAAKSNVIFAIIIMSVSLIEIYLIVRSSFLSRIKEVGIFRAIGMKKIDIYKMFFGEIFTITSIFSMLGVVFMTYVISQLSKIQYISNNYYMNGFIFIGIVLFIYVFNILIGLLPVIGIVSKTPAKILSRNDI
ncbi:MAG: ABC transporter ATP-binding protein/permease [Tenericutes bacterium]|nr:ABC transporter ATP-binding protein/permease [Mycoplasmatota bacterium]